MTPADRECGARSGWPQKRSARAAQARRGVPVDLHVTMEGPGCTGGRVRGGATFTSLRTKNSRGPGARQTGRIQNSIRLNNRARPDVRRKAVAIAAGRLPQQAIDYV